MDYTLLPGFFSFPLAPRALTLGGKEDERPGNEVEDGHNDNWNKYASNFPFVFKCVPKLDTFFLVEFSALN